MASTRHERGSSDKSITQLDKPQLTSNKRDIIWLHNRFHSRGSEDKKCGQRGQSPLRTIDYAFQLCSLTALDFRRSCDYVPRGLKGWSASLDEGLVSRCTDMLRAVRWGSPSGLPRISPARAVSSTSHIIK